MIRPYAGPGRIAVLAVFLFGSGCEPRQAEQTQMQRILELEAHVEELETRLTQAWMDMSQLSNELTASVRSLDVAVGEVERRIIDIHSADLQFTVPEIQASVAVARQRLADVQQTTNELARAVAP